LLNAANFFETAKSKKKSARKDAETQRFVKTFLQDDYGKIIKKLLNHLAIIILRGIAPRFIYAGSLAGGAFLEAGDVWNSDTEVIKAGNFLDDAKLNAGVEFSFLFTTIFDMPIPLTFGYGHNLWSAKEKGLTDSGRFYLKFDTPVTLFAALFGY